MTPTQVAKEFDIKPPSVYSWYDNGSIDKKHYQHLLDWSGKPIEWWLDLRPRPQAAPGVLSDFARALGQLLDSLPDAASKNAVFMDCCEVIKAASITTPCALPAPMPAPFVKPETSSE